jgi:phosphatidylserine synthase
MSKGASRTLAHGEGNEIPALVASIPANAQQRWVVFGIAASLSVVFAIVLPFAQGPAARLDVFIPVVQTIIFVADLITAVLLFAQYSIQPQRALLALASGYIFSGLFAFPQTLELKGSSLAERHLGEVADRAA